MADVQLFDRDAVLTAVPAGAAIESTRTAFRRHAAGDWEMPPKVYVDAPPNGDFRAMPARGDGLATLKWVTSFPDNPARGLPVVAGALLVSSAETGELLAIMDCAAITSLRTGAAAAVSAQALARARRPLRRPDRVRRQRRLGGPLPGGRGLRRRRLLRPEAGGVRGARRRARLARRRTRRSRGAGRRRHGHPGPRTGDRRRRPTPRPASGGARRRRPRQGRGRARGARALQPLLRRVGAGIAGRRALGRGRAPGPSRRERVTEIGDVLLERRPGRRRDDEITLFDSTGLAIQDLGLAAAVLSAWRAGDAESTRIAI